MKRFGYIVLNAILVLFVSTNVLFAQATGSGSAGTSGGGSSVSGGSSTTTTTTTESTAVNPVWIVIGAVALLLLIIALASRSRSGSKTTVIKS